MSDITLAITTIDRGHLLRRSLERLEHLTKPHELIVVDDGGVDDTAAVCAEFVGRLPIKYIYNHNPGHTICSTARNIALRACHTEYFATSEPELMYRTDVLAQFAQLALERPNDVISAGTIWHTNEGTEGVPADLPEAEMWQWCGRTEGWVAPFTAMYRTEWLFEINGWDEAFPGPWGWDDTDLLTRLRVAGRGQHIALDVEAVHQWHPKGSDPGQINEAHFMAKGFHQDWTDQTETVANKGVPWGILKTPS